MRTAFVAARNPQPAACGFFSRQRITARADFNRWLMPPAALAIQLCIGMAYGFSVFWIPLSQAVGGARPVPCGPQTALLDELFVTHCDWRISTLAWTYSLFFVFLGCSAALWGAWTEKVGPRVAGMVSALCWCGGLMVSALGVHLHQLWLLWLGSGVIGGIGLGLGYISPIATLIAWYPDRRGLATGMAVMGFGGGAMVGAPLAVALMQRFTASGTPGTSGVSETFVVLAVLYFVFMMGGALGLRLPPAGWQPQRRKPALASPSACRSGAAGAAFVDARKVWRIWQFWLVWVLVCLNISAGIGLLGMASPMLQEVFGGALIGVPQRLAELQGEQLAAVAGVAAGFAALLSLFNIAGRLAWAAVSDYIGCKPTFALLLALGALLYLCVPASASDGNKPAFVLSSCLIISLYGGGFGTAPAYLAELFGARMVGPIYARLLTAVAAAGVLGPLLVHSLRNQHLLSGQPPEQVYQQIMAILALMLCAAFVLNLLMRPVHARHFVQALHPDVDRRQATPAFALAPADLPAAGVRRFSGKQRGCVVLAWLAIAVPLGWGVYEAAIGALRLVH